MNIQLKHKSTDMYTNYSPILAQSKYHKRKTWKKTTRLVLSVHYPSVVASFYTMAVLLRVTIDPLCEGIAGMLGNSVLLMGRRGAENSTQCCAHQATNSGVKRTAG